jgi:hypothetical protein
MAELKSPMLSLQLDSNCLGTGASTTAHLDSRRHQPGSSPVLAPPPAPGLVMSAEAWAPLQAADCQRHPVRITL